MVDIVSRAEWGARAPKHRYRIQIMPTLELWLHHTAGNERGVTGMRSIQNFHMDKRGWSDIAYSFLIDRQDLTIYEGRGAGIKGGHTFGRNSISHAICIMGNFETLIPDDKLLARIAELVRHGHEQGWWPARFTGGHRDVATTGTACPGNNLYIRIGEINRLATAHQGEPVSELVRRIQQVPADFGYSEPVTGRLIEQNAADIEHIGTGLRKRMAEVEQLRAELIQVRGEMGAWQKRATEAEEILAEWAKAIGDNDPATLVASHKDLTELRRILNN